MRFLPAAIAALVLTTACSTSTEPEAPPPPSGGKLTVVATAYPLFEVASRVGGDRVDPHNLRPLDALDDQPADQSEAQELAGADLVVTLGKGTQPAIDAALGGRPAVRVLDSVETTTPAGGYSGLPTDPFVWLDTRHMATVIDSVKQALISADPAGAKYYDRNARSYGRLMAGIDRNYSRTLARCIGAELYTSDPAYGYLARRYGLRQVAVADMATVPDGSTVFAAELPPLDEARGLLADRGIRVAVLDPIVNQTDQARRGGATYDRVMALNLDALRSGLPCAERS